jgi:hypothetical protein
MKRIVGALLATIALLLVIIAFMAGRMTKPKPKQSPDPVQSVAIPSRSKQEPMVAAVKPSLVTKLAVEASDYDTIPSEFRGTWAETKLGCKKVDEHYRESIVTISARKIGYYEATGTVDRVTPVGDPDGYAVKLTYAGEGEIWESTAKLRRNGNTLQIEDSGMGGVTGVKWVLCP